MTWNRSSRKPQSRPRSQLRHSAPRTPGGDMRSRKEPSSLEPRGFVVVRCKDLETKLTNCEGLVLGCVEAFFTTYHYQIQNSLFSLLFFQIVPQSRRWSRLHSSESSLIFDVEGRQFLKQPTDPPFAPANVGQSLSIFVQNSVNTLTSCIKIARMAR